MALAGILAASPTDAAAQSWTLATTGELAGDDVSLLAGHFSIQPGRTEGLVPYAFLGAYRVGTETDDTWSLVPGVGLRMVSPTGMVGLGAGYQFREDAGMSPFFGGDADGWVLESHLEHWGTGAFGAQAIGSYNLDSEYLWARGRLTARLAEMSGGSSVHGGAEFVYQGDFEQEVDPYRAKQGGPLLQWHSGSGVIVGAGGGWKETSVLSDDTWYAKVEFVLSR